jgi:hypothetical protein
MFGRKEVGFLRGNVSLNIRLREQEKGFFYVKDISEKY